MNSTAASGSASIGLFRTIANLQTNLMQKLLTDGTQNSPATQAAKAASIGALTPKEQLAQGKPLYA